MRTMRRIAFATVLIIGTLVSISLATSCSRSRMSNETEPSSARQTLYLYNWTYYTPDSIIEAFEEEFHAHVVMDYYASNEDMFAKLRASGGGYDIVVPSADYVSIMSRLGMLLPLDHAKLPNLRYVDPAVVQKAVYDPGMQYSVPYYMGAAGIAVDTSKVSDYARDWTIFSDGRYAGRMQLLDDMHEVLGIAQATLGYSVNTREQSELEHTADYINSQWKPNIVKFDSEAFGKAFSRGEFWVSHCYPEVIFEEVPASRHGDIDFFLPQSGGPLYIDSMVILKDAPNPDLAHAFIDFFHRPEIHAWFLDEFSYPSTVNRAADAYRTSKPLYDKEALAPFELKVDLGEDLAAYDAVWQTVRYH